jgi:3-hydroxyacyl-CoA dehydrogenase
MNQENEKNTEFLIPEPIPLLKERKGGGLNLIHVALLLEAARMIDEGMDIPSVEVAVKKAFGVSKGFLSAMDEAGIVEACSVMETLADDSDPEDPFFKFYHNFFSPPESCKDKIQEMERAEDKETVKWISEEEARQEAKDFVQVDALVRRFQAVAFITSVEVVESEILDLHDVARPWR